MGRLTPKIPPFEYLGGRELTDKLKEVVGVGTDLQLADVVGVPKGTISTWHQRNLTPYELILRLCLAKGVNIEYLALGKGEPYAQGSELSSSEVLNAQHLENGAISELDPVVFDKSYLGGNLSRENCIALFTDSSSYLINTNDTSPTSGNYLIDVDGVFSINKVRRLPGKKLSVDFDGSLIDVAEGDIKVIGRVVMSMVKQ
ncbi:transcriptional regulator [Grimontia hollisae]|uniref:phage repressor protein CI n=1 Tax=Grimontia hollisae TaxID=673 RepID=UPI00058C9655|nr:phage repressor protein CI [Grimontia hollisae]AMG30797.1 transcriptional regulator [Grimontia hollisae]STO47387.1 Bacteriophage CI repressor helix-turn-helix domain [Grimontia hollisae]